MVLSQPIMDENDESQSVNQDVRVKEENMDGDDPNHQAAQQHQPMSLQCPGISSYNGMEGIKAEASHMHGMMHSPHPNGQPQRQPRNMYETQQRYLPDPHMYATQHMHMGGAASPMQHGTPPMHPSPMQEHSSMYQGQMGSPYSPYVYSGQTMQPQPGHSDQGMYGMQGPEHSGMPQPYMGMKTEPNDPYNFVEEEGGQDHRTTPIDFQSMGIKPETPMPKKRGRKKKLRPEMMNGMPPDGMDFSFQGYEDLPPTPSQTSGEIGAPKPRKKWDRFNGMSVEDVKQRTLPDHLAPNLDIIIVGINPGLFAAYKGHHYAGPGNHFWKCMYLSGLIPEPMTADDDYRLIGYGIGFTNMVARPTKGSQDLSRREMKEGGLLLTDKIRKFKPKIVVFNGKGIYEVYSGKKEFTFGKQPETVDGTNTIIWVMPSSSARCAQLPRASDKVPYYMALKKLRDYLNGHLKELDESEVVFPDVKMLEGGIKKEVKQENEGGEPKPPPAPPVPVYDPATGTYVFKKKRGRPRKIRPEELANLPLPPPPPPPPPMPEQHSIPTPEEDGVVVKKRRGRPPKKLQLQSNHQQSVQGSSDSVAQMDSERNFLCSPHPGGSSQSQQYSGNYSPYDCHANHNPDPPYQSSTSMAVDLRSGSPGDDNTVNPADDVGKQYEKGTPPSALDLSGQEYKDSSVPPMSLDNQNLSSGTDAENSGSSPNQTLDQLPPPQPTDEDKYSHLDAALPESSPLPPSPSLGPADFSPPAHLPTEKSDNSLHSGGEEPTENKDDCQSNFGGDAAAAAAATRMYTDYHSNNYGPSSSDGSYVAAGDQNHVDYCKDERPQDMSSKSLSGLESLVDQIPSLANGEAGDGAPNYASPMDNNQGFSISSLAHSSVAAHSSPESGFLHSSYSVSNLASSSSPPMRGAYSSSPSPYSTFIAPTAGFMGAPMGMTLGGMGMTPYGYSQYSSGSYSTPAGSFPYASPASLHVPSPHYPYANPYSNNPYQPGYQGFGSF